MSKLPGVTTQNVLNVLNKGHSLINMLTMSLQELQIITNNSTDAENLYNALHKKFKSEQFTVKPLSSKGFQATIGKKRFKYTNSKTN